MIRLLLLAQMAAPGDAALAAAIDRRVAATDSAQVAVAFMDQKAFDRGMINAMTARDLAHKTGEITAVSHDGGIVYPPGRAPYVIVVLTRGVRDGRASAALIADISRLVYQHATTP